MWFFFFLFGIKRKKKTLSIQDLIDPMAEKVGVEVDNDRVVLDNMEGGRGSALMVEMGQKRVVESWVTVESMANMCIRWWRIGYSGLTKRTRGW